MRALLTCVLVAAAGLPLAAQADPITPGTLGAGGFYVSGGGFPLDLDQSQTDFTIVQVPPTTSGNTVTGVSCGNNFVCKTAAPGTDGTTVTYRSAPDPSVQLAMSLGSGSFHAEEVDALVQYYYAVAGGATSGTLSFNLQTSQAGYTSGVPSATAQIYLDGTLIAICGSAPAALLNANGTGQLPSVSCGGTSLTAAVPVSLLSSGELDLFVYGDISSTPTQGATAFALVDPTLTADNGAAITLSDGFGNGAVLAPEPALLGVFGLSFGCLVGLRRRRFCETRIA